MSPGVDKSPRLTFARDGEGQSIQKPVHSRRRRPPSETVRIPGPADMAVHCRNVHQTKALVFSAKGYVPCGGTEIAANH
jgi:hypothetical protein